MYNRTTIGKYKSVTLHENILFKSSLLELITSNARSG
uniref:Uncharacterized protein n=1 Tax=Rhizophora mucronata TaxID=61149 RepID=A0A2P2PWD1_RHIMU